MAFIILIVYVGAISILFLFVVMMLDLRVVELHSTFFNYLPIGSFIGILFFFEVSYFVLSEFSMYNFGFLDSFDAIFFDKLIIKSNIVLFGEILYNYFNFLVLVMSLVLLISMVGSIILTMDFKEKFESLDLNIYNKSKVSVERVSFWSNSSRQ